MKKTEMLKKNYEFRRVLSKGKYYTGKTIEAFVIKNNKNKDKNFIGLAISSKLAKANKRNLIKRLIREAYKNSEEKIIKGNSIVFLWKKTSNIKKDINYSIIEQDILKILDRANLIKKEE